MDKKELLTLRKKVIERGDVNALKTLLAQSPRALTEKDYKGDTILIHAAKRSQPDIVRFIINESDINLNHYLNLQNNDGRTALTEAVVANAVCVVKELTTTKNARVNVNVQDVTGKTPLMYAAILGEEDMIDTLIAAGARTDIKTPDGRGVEEFAKNSNIRMFFKGMNAEAKRHGQFVFVAERKEGKVIITQKQKNERVNS